MSAYIHVLVDEIQTKSARSRKNPNNENLEYSQKAWFHTGGRFPIEMEINLPVGIQFYQPGEYVVDLAINTAPDKYQGMGFKAFSKTRLIPVTPDFIKNLNIMNDKLNEMLPH
jgi:hypothetical protein